MMDWGRLLSQSILNKSALLFIHKIQLFFFLWQGKRERTQNAGVSEANRHHVFSTTNNLTPCYKLTNTILTCDLKKYC